MAEINFPTSPINGETYTYNGVTYEYNATRDQWVKSTNIAPSSLLAVSTNIVPSANLTYDLGTSNKRWRDLYLSGNTIYIGDGQITSVKYLQLHHRDELEVTTGDARWVAPSDMTIVEVLALVGSAPQGANCEGVININGNNAINFSIQSGNTSSGAITTNQAVNKNDYLTVDITNVGSSNTGSDLNVVLSYELS